MSGRIPVGFRFYWDDQCRLCNSFKTIAEHLDWSKRVVFLPLTSAPADIDLGHLSMEERFASSHLVDPDGRVISQARGILALAQLLPLTAPLVFFFRLLPASEAIAERLYSLGVRHRGAPFGGSCRVEYANLDDDDDDGHF